MEPDTSRSDCGAGDDPPPPAKPRDCSISSVESDPSNTSPVSNPSTCPRDVDGPVSGPRISIANLDCGAQFYQESTSDALTSLGDAFQNQMDLVDSLQSYSTRTEEGQATRRENAPQNGHGDNGNMRMSQASENPAGRQVLSPQFTNRDASPGEPFPDYYESCEGNSQLVDTAQEKAYNYAISKVVEEVIRFREVDTTITALPAPSEHQITTADETKGIQENGNNDGSPPEEWIRAGEGEVNKLNAFENLARLLSDPKLKQSTQQRFMGITNMVIRMEHLLFSQHGPNPAILVLTDRDLWELNIMASEMTRYLISVDAKLQELVDDGSRVAHILSHLAKEPHVSTWVRYKRMAKVVIRNLKKPRSVERRLLGAFRTFYDSYVYAMFLLIYNPQIMQEGMPSAAKINLCRLLIGLWDLLNRSIQNYELYVKMMVDMRDTYFSPMMEELGRCPAVWQESWDQRQEIEQVYGESDGQWF